LERANFSLNVFPVPADNKLNIEFENTGLAQIELIDINGKILFQTETFEAIYNLDVSNFLRGTYILKIVKGGKIDFKKIIIER